MKAILPGRIQLSISVQELGILQRALANWRGPFANGFDLSPGDLKHHRKCLALAQEMREECESALYELHIGERDLG
jgi:hypothetical protein